MEDRSLFLRDFFFGTFGVTLTTPSRQKPLTEIHGDISRFGYSDQYSPAFQQFMDKWQFEIGHRESKERLLLICIPVSAFVKIEFYFTKYLDGYALTCIFLAAHQPLPSQKECYAHEERIGFAFGQFDNKQYGTISRELNKLATEIYIEIDPQVRVPEEDESPYFVH
jgi:hypothetical protein